MSTPIEDGRAASKSPHKTFGYFLSFSQQEVSADIIQNSAVGNLSPKTEGTKTKAARCLFFLMSFPFLSILNSLQSSLTVYIMQSLSACVRDCRLQRLKQEWQKSTAGTNKNKVWFGEIERKLAKLSKTAFTYRSSC